MGLKVDVATDARVDPGQGYQEIINGVCSECALGYDDELYTGVRLTDNEKIREFNREFRNIDKATDVLSFPLLLAENGNIEYTDLDRDMDTGAVMLGDIIISIDRAREQAEDYGHSYDRELAFLTCHGMLHLLGYDHETDEEESIMLARQKEILGRLGYKKGD